MLFSGPLAAFTVTLIALLPASAAADPPAFVERYGVLAMEAEHATSNTGYRRVDTAAASGGAVMQVPKGTQGAAASLDFRVHLVSGGTYHVWIRANATDHLNNGLHLRLDGKDLVAPPSSKHAGVKDVFLKRPGWFWEPEWQGPGKSNRDVPVTFEAPAGFHTFSVVNRGVEDPLIDKVVLSLTRDRPLGLGPDETVRGRAARVWKPRSPVLTVAGRGFRLDGRPFDMWGVRVASAPISDASTEHLVAQLDDYRAHGVNTVSVFYQGSSAGSLDPFSPDGRSIAPAVQARMELIIREAAARDMVVIAGIFYQRVERPQLRDWEAAREAVGTVTRALAPHRNVIINVANEQNSRHYRDKPWSKVGDVDELVALCALVRKEDSRRLVGAGGYDHEANVRIGRAAAVSVLLFDTDGPAPTSGELHARFLAAGVRKPMVNVETFGAWTNAFLPQGVFPEEVKRRYVQEVEGAARYDGLYLHLHNTPWFQAFAPKEHSRYDLGGTGTKEDPGVRWYFEAVRQRAARPGGRVRLPRSASPATRREGT